MERMESMEIMNRQSFDIASIVIISGKVRSSLGIYRSRTAPHPEGMSGLF